MRPEIKWESKEGQKVARELAKVINMMTGRGNIWVADKLGNASPVANQVMFSIRKFSADLNMLDPTNYIGWGKYSKLDPFVRKMALKQLVGSLAITTTVLGLAKMSGAEIETNPTSSDFAKIHIGNRYYDITGGKTSMLAFITKILLSESKDSSTGVVTELGAYEKGYKTWMYQRGKLAPAASLLIDVLYKEDYEGNAVETPVEILGAVGKRIYPMGISDAVDCLNDPITGNEFANVLLELGSFITTSHGIGVSTRDSGNEEFDYEIKE
jgi:hypothetical protein